MVNLAEHEIFSANIYKMSRIEKCSCSAKFSKKEFATVSNLRFISRTNFIYSCVEHEKKFCNLRTVFDYLYQLAKLEWYSPWFLFFPWPFFWSHHVQYAFFWYSIYFLVIRSHCCLWSKSGLLKGMYSIRHVLDYAKSNVATRTMRNSM